MKKHTGRYIAQDGDLRIEVAPADRKLHAPAMYVVSLRRVGRWEYLRSFRLDDTAEERRARDGYQRVGERGLTRYWRKV